MEQEYIKLVVDCETHTEQYVPMTEEEIIQFKKDMEESKLNAEKALQEQLDKDKLKESAIQKLMSLGLTKEEAEALKS